MAIIFDRVTNKQMDRALVDKFIDRLTIHADG